MKTVIPLLAAVALFSGCLCLGGGESPPQEMPETAPAVEVADDIDADNVIAPEGPLLADAGDGVGALSAEVSACGDDDGGNAMVAGYVRNGGDGTAEAVTVVTRLLSSDGHAIEGGVREVDVGSLQPGESRKFSSVYVRPGEWARCSAAVNPR
jgi:hypothetical protein